MKSKTNIFAQFKFASAVKEKMFSEMEQEGERLALPYFANKIGVSQATLSRVTNGSPPDVESFCKLLKWLGKEASEFYI